MSVDSTFRDFNDYLQTKGIRTQDISINDAIYEVLGDLGFRGSIDERLRAAGDVYGLRGQNPLSIASSLSGSLSTSASILSWTETLAWWDASFGLSQTGSGVSSWVDRKNSYALIQGTDASRPLYSQTGFNSFPGLTFDGTDDFLSMESQPFGSGDGNFEIWAVVQNDTLSATSGNKFAVSVGAPSLAANIVRNTNNVLRATSGIYLAEASGPFSTRHTVRAVFKTGFVSISVDGAALTEVVSIPAIGTTRVRVGSNISDTASAFWQGKIRDVVVTGLLSTGQASELQSFLLPRRAL